jgi:hypothetical protein
MQPSTRFSLVEVDRTRNRACVAVEGKRTALSVEGVMVEAQFDVGDGSALVLATEDSPHDEGLHVYLLGPDGTVEDALEAGATFSAGILEIQGVGADWIDLRFFRNDLLYRMEIRARPQVQLLLPAGWRYKRRLAMHRLRVVTRTGALHG